MSTRKELTPPDEEVKYGRGKYLGGSRLEDLFDIVRTGEYAFGGLLARFKELKAQNELVQARGERLDTLTTIKQTADVMFAGPVHGIRHRISPSAVFEVEGFWKEMAVDTVFDPTTYTPLGLWRVAKVGYAAIPRVANRLGVGGPVTKVGEALGEAFVPGYRIKQLPGKDKEYFNEYLDWVLRKRGARLQMFHELKQMAKPFKRSGEAITEYIESGRLTGNKALDKYIDEVILPSKFAHQTKRRIPHEITEMGRVYEGKLNIDARKQLYRRTIEAVNKEAGFDVFEPDFWKATAISKQRWLHDEYIEQWFKHSEGKYGVDPAAPIAKHLEDLVTPPTAGAGKLYDWALAWWKRSVTVGFALFIHPAFFVRNVYSGIYQNWQRTGMWNPMDYYRGIQARLGMGTFKTAERGTISGAEMQRILREQSIMGQPGMTDVIHETMWERTIWQKVRDTPAWFMTETENLVRIPEFVKLTRQISLKEARDITYQTHFAYLPEFHTKFEMKGMKRLFPFYTWMSRNIPFTIQRTLEQPGKLAGVGRLQQKLIKHYGMEEEYERRAEWQRNMFLIPNVFRGGRGWIGIGLPFADLTMDLEDVYFSVSPIKLIPELGYMQSGWGMDWASKERKRKKQKEAVMRVLEGRYGTTAKRLARTRDPVDKLMYLAAMPTYRAASKDVAAFDAARWRDPRPSKPQQYAAWVAAGQPEDFRTKSLPDDTLLALTAEEYEVSQGFQPTEEQLQDILTGPAGKEERYRRLVAEWNAFRTSEARLEYPSREQRMESWRRAGKLEKYIQRVYRDDAGKLLGVLTLTPADVRMLGTFRLNEAQKVWMFRETRKMKPLAQVRIWIEEHAAEMSQRQEMREELTELYRGVRATKGADIPDALRTGGGDARWRRRRELEEALRIGVDT